jgi:hypothetical protein
MTGEQQPGSEATLTWVHGHTGETQSAHGFQVERLGQYLRLKAEQPSEAWVHYGPPTMLAGARITILLSVMIRFRTFGSAVLDRVHVWDGGRRIAEHDSLNVQYPADPSHPLTGGSGDFGDLELALGAPEPLSSAVGVSLLVSAPNALDAIAISAIGLKLSIR